MAYSITIEETLNDVTVTSTNYPITISYNAVQLDGEVGPGVAAGGTTGQVLKKASDDDYDTIWVDHSTLGLNNIVEDTTPQLGGDLDVNGSNIVSTGGGNISIVPDTDGDIQLTASGEGIVSVLGDISVSGDLSMDGTGTIYSGNNVLSLNDAGDVSLSVGDGTLSILSTGGASLLDSSGVEGGVQVGNSSAPVKIYYESSSPVTGTTITTPSSTALNITTNSGTNSGYIKITPGADQNIVLSPNGTGKIQLDNNYWPNTDGAANQVLITNGSGVLSWSSVVDLGAVGPSGADGTSFVWQGEWNSGFTYAANDVVEYNGSSYISLDVSLNQNPETTTGYWELMASVGEMGPNTTISESEPMSATEGEQWFNPSNQVLSVYTSSGWVQVGADDLYF